MKLLTASMVGVVAAMALTSCMSNGEGKHPAAQGQMDQKNLSLDGRYYKLHGGWYALNYPYYYGYGPAVGHSDPYDYNGHYFPDPSRQQ